MKMPMGKFKGQPVDAMTTAYLIWLVSNDHIRFKRWPLIKEALHVLRSRFDTFDQLLDELKVESQPPAYWKTPEFAEKRKQEKAEKLRQLEERRGAERQQRRYMPRMAELPQQRQIVDTSRSDIETRLQALHAELARREQANSNDVSDLV